MDSFDFSILSLNELDMPEDVIINYSHIINNSNLHILNISQENIDYMRPILLALREILRRY
jgi:hypothetical protein